jgi:hypothetical protein
MSNTVVCSELTGAIDKSCVRNLAKKYFQEAVIINLNDIDKTASYLGDISSAICDYTVKMVLKSGKKGIQVKLPESGNAIKGFTGKSKDTYNNPQYLHQAQFLMLGASAETKCQMDKLDHGRYVVALQLIDGTIEIYGWENGLSTGDYTYDIVEGGGGSLIVLQSDETAQESMLPMVYKPQEAGDANADFNEQFESAV